MKCPSCEHGVLIEKAHNTLLIDVCNKCRGIWLDRGELETIIAFATNEFDDDTPTRTEAEPTRGRDRARRDSNDDPGRRLPRADSDDGFDDGRPGQRPRRKKRWFDMFGEIFD